jgi:sugar transferase (PEP-CTERM system associated)
VIRILNVYFPARTVLLGVSEVMLVCLAFTLAVFLRMGRDADLLFADEHGLLKIGIVAATYLLCMYYLDLYESRVLGNRHEVLTRQLQVLGLGSVILAILYYAYPQAQLGRGVFLLGMLVVIPVLILWRELFRHLVKSLHLAERTLIVGHGPLAKALTSELRKRPELGLDLVGWVDVSQNGSGMDGLPFMGELTQLPEVAREHKIGRLVIAMEDRRGNLPLDELLTLKSNGAVVQEGTELYESVTGKISLNALRRGWLLFSASSHGSRRFLLSKKAFSLALSLFGLLVSLPALIVVAIAIKLDSKGPIFYCQKRVGKNGKTFTLYKFRTMIDGADLDGQHRPAQSNDDRFTRVGRWLRRTRLDEVPQMFNILRGDMEFVGPRPFVPGQEEECARQIPFYSHRWAVKPGVTGWAQINHGYCATIEDNIEKASYDLYYIKHMSIGLDLLILFRTVKTVLLARGSR